MVTVDGTLAGQPFVATLEPDGQGSHWLKVEKKLREAAGVATGDSVSLEIAPVEKEPEPKVPADLKQALAGNPAAKAIWKEITAVARRDWIHWITSGKKSRDPRQAHRHRLRQARLRQSARLLFRPLGHVQQGQHGRAGGCGVR